MLLVVLLYTYLSFLPYLNNPHHIEYLHKNDIQVSDLNQYNMYFSLNGKILFVDVDSYQTPDNKLIDPVVLEDIRDFQPEVDRAALVGIQVKIA